MVLATYGGRIKSGLATLLGPRALDVHRQRLVLGFRLSVGLGGVSLRTLVAASASRLALESGSGMGTGMGDVESG